MSQEPRHSEDEEYARAARRYSVSFMSNAKWVRLFRAVNDENVAIERAEWRFIDSDHAIWVSFPSPKDVLPSRFADGEFQPFEYRWIESVFIPREYAPAEGVGLRRQQDIQGMRRAIEAAGQFEMDENEAGLTILAYRE